MSEYYQKIKKHLIKYQKTEKYRAYRREYEPKYRAKNREKLNFNSWRSMRKKKNGVYPTPNEVRRYLKRRDFRNGKHLVYDTETEVF